MLSLGGSGARRDRAGSMRAIRTRHSPTRGPTVAGETPPPRAHHDLVTDANAFHSKSACAVGSRTVALFAIHRFFTANGAGDTESEREDSGTARPRPATTVSPKLRNKRRKSI